MMRHIKMLGAVLLAALLTACGGGGGSPGTTGGSTGTGGGTGTTTVATPTITVELRDSADHVVTVVSTTAIVYAKATVKSSTGVAVASQVVTFTSDTSLVKFLPLAGSALTDASGVAIVQIQPASTSAAGAGTLVANVTVSGVAATPANYNYQVPIISGNSSAPTISLGLRDSTNSSTTVIGGTSTVTARAVLLDGGGTPVAGALVTFAGDASLVKFSPAGGTVLTNSSGVATIQVSPASVSSAGAGTLRVSAAVAGTPVSQTFDFQIAGVTSSAGVPTMSLGLRDSSNTSTNSVNASGITTARAAVLDATGAPVTAKLVTFSGDLTLIKFSPASGQVLTDANGVATVQITPASLSAAGASTLRAATTVAGTAVSASFDFQLSSANLALQNLNVGSTSLAAFGNRAVSVVATINGVPATNTPIQVTFTASCGSLTPAVAVTDSTGTASTTYTADNPNCAGSNVSVSAAAAGATPLSGTIAVQASQATNIQFMSASPTLIYLVGSVGATQSQVTFKVVGSSGNPLQNQQVQLSLVNSAPGVSLNTVGNTATVALTSDATGLVSVAVFSGTVPTSVQVRAVLATNTAVSATSNILTVASGRPVQRAISVALSKFSIEGLNVDGSTSRVTISLADRQGNPVPDGTQVNFVTKYGLMIPASCLIAGGTSSCAVDIRSQGDRSAPFKGRVAILAYVPGEEDFVDLNGNNVYDPGEPFTDMGNAYRDEFTSTVSGVSGVVDGTYTVGEFIVPRAGTSTCLDKGVPNNGGVNGRDGTCDGVWGTVDVRVQTMIQFASSGAVMTLVGSATTGGFTVSIADINGNSMPTGSSIAASIFSAGPTCAVSATLPTSISNTYLPTNVVVGLKNCVSGDKINLAITTPGIVAGPVATNLLVTLP